MCEQEVDPRLPTFGSRDRMKDLEAGKGRRAFVQLLADIEVGFACCFPYVDDASVRSECIEAVGQHTGSKRIDDEVDAATGGEPHGLVREVRATPVDDELRAGRGRDVYLRRITDRADYRRAVQVRDLREREADRPADRMDEDDVPWADGRCAPKDVPCRQTRQRERRCRAPVD